MRTLHVAALPFPSPQGTQALLLQMLRALGNAGHDTHLLCYAHGGAEPSLQDAPFTVHRVRARSRSDSLRSGPTLDKLRLDVSLVRALARLTQQLRPELIVAHHVEAAACALLTNRMPWLFVAHTSLAEELPTYLPPKLRSLARWTALAGERLDVALVRRAARSFAVSPLLAQMLTQTSDRVVESLPLPWPVARATTPLEREVARAALRLEPAHEVALYAGNLDGYQGLDTLLPALARVSTARPALRLLIATESDTRDFASLLARHGLARCAQFVPLAGEATRVRVHAAADLALVPRRSAGGLPIKLLDALARGLPTVSARAAWAGHTLADYGEVVDAVDGWEAAITRVLVAPALARRRAERGRSYVEREHHDERFVAVLRALSDPSQQDAVRA